MNIWRKKIGQKMSGFFSTIIDRLSTTGALLWTSILILFSTSVIIIFIVTLFVGSFGAPSDVKNSGYVTAAEINDTLHRARRYLIEKEYGQAIQLWQKYLRTTSAMRGEALRHFYVIGELGSLLLYKQKNPDQTIQLFSTMLKHKGFSEAEQDILLGWIAAANEFKIKAELPLNKIQSADLFAEGKKFFNIGKEKSKFFMDQNGQPAFAISFTYLFPILISGEDKFLDETLYMVGEMKARSWPDNQYNSESHYLLEVIRRRPHSRLAVKSWNLLLESIRLGYSGSGGNNTPKSWRELLEELKEVTEPEGKTKLLSPFDWPIS